MANYVENFNSKLDWAMPFQRTGKFPLDRTDLFSSYDDAVKYAAGNTEDPDSRGLCGTSYVGQIITVYENDNVTVYKINATRKLDEVGTATAGDGKSIDLGDGNVLSLKNFGKKYYRYVPASEEGGEATYELVEDGTFPAGLQPKTRLADDGHTIELAWYEPSTTTVEGLSEQMASLTETVNTMQETVSNNTQNIANKVDKIEGKQLSTEDYTTEEKSKLSGIAAGAQVNVIEGIQVNGETKAPEDKIVKLTVPTKVSDLTNDSNFIDSTVGNLTNYYLKTETYTKNEVNDLLSAISTMTVLVVDALPEDTISTTTIYLVAKSATGENDIYDEYLYINEKWEKIGNTQIDLTNYLQKNGDASNVTATFVAAGTREIPASGEALNIILGKIIKYLTDLHQVAFTGNYSDLQGAPTITSTQTTELTISAGQTSVSTSNDIIGKLVSWYAYDATTNEMLICEVTKTPGTSGDGSSFNLTASISAAHTNDIKVIITSVK